MDVKTAPLVQLCHDTRLSLTQQGDLTSLAAYVYRTLSLMTNHSLFPCFLLPFDLCRYPLMEEYVFADTWNMLNPPDETSGHRHQIKSIASSGLVSHLFQSCRYLLLLPGESKGGLVSRGQSCWLGTLTCWNRHMEITVILILRIYTKYKALLSNAKFRLNKFSPIWIFLSVSA